MVNAPDCDSGTHRFKSDIPPHPFLLVLESNHKRNVDSDYYFIVAFQSL